ncbi:hypothetical protein [Rodentibacter genomosp. 2]
MSQTEKAKYQHHAALQQNSHAQAFNDLFKIMSGRKSQLQGATA